MNEPNLPPMVGTLSALPEHVQKVVESYALAAIAINRRAAVQAAQPESVGLWQYRPKHPKTGEVVGPWMSCQDVERARACGYEVRQVRECRACDGEGWTEQGDPEIGSAKFDCPTCSGDGCFAAAPTPEPMSAPTEAKPDESLFNLLFAVEQAANNGALHWEVEEAFRAYEVSKAAVMHKPSGFTFDQVIACATPDDLMPLTAQIHPTTEPDCSGGIACTTCPDKRKCQRGCIRQGEALENPNRKDLRTECDAVDALLRGLGLDPDRCRTEGGVLNVGRTLSLLKDGCTEAKPAQPCGHPESLLLKSAETGEPLYCEACDDKSGRRDAEQRETELLAANQALREKIAAPSKPAQDAVDADMVLRAARELCRIHAGECQVNEQDTWNLYAEQFKRDADAVLRAAISAKKGQP